MCLRRDAGIVSDMDAPMDHGPHAGGTRPLKASRFPLGLRIVTFALSVCGTVLLVLAVSRFQSQGGSGYPYGELKNARDASIATSMLFALSAIHLARGPATGRRVWPLLGALAAGTTVLLILVFGLNFIDCGSSCFPPVPSDLIRPAIAFSLLCILLGIAGAVAAGDRV
jgi:hypothetical protein